LGIKNGSFDFLQGSIGGLNQSIGSGVFLQSIGFEVHVNPLVLAGSIGVSGGPSVAGVKAVAVNGTLKATLADPFVIEVNGSGNGTVPGPGVTVTGPKGETVTVSPEAPLVQTSRFRAELLDDGTTMVLVNKPAAGVWTVAGDGRVPITRIREARGLPKPSIKA